MRHLVILFFSFLLIFSFCINLSAQNRTDFGLWTGLRVNQKITKKFSASLRGQVRLDGNANYFSSTFANVGLGYKFHKMIGIAAGYRYSIKPERNSHRVYGDIKFSYSPKKSGLALKIRLRGQYGTSSNQTVIPSTTLRPRFYVGYSPKGKVPKRFKFYMTGEVFYEFVQSTSSLSKYRISGGVSYELSKEISVGLRYIMQDELGATAPVQEHILSIGLEVDLPKLKKKKKKKKKKKED
jgi:opacity protein-like surface antigen